MSCKLNKNVHGSVEGVQDITDTSLGQSEIQRALNAAYYVTLPIASDLTDCGGTAALGEIQNYIAAHLIAIGRERQTKRESIAGEASVTFTGKTAMGLDATLYGQTAKVMDCSGQLARLGLKKATFQVWDHDQIDYDSESEDYETGE